MTTPPPEGWPRLVLGWGTKPKCPVVLSPPASPSGGPDGSEVGLVSGLGAKLLLVPGARGRAHRGLVRHVGQRVGPDDVPAGGTWSQRGSGAALWF